MLSITVAIAILTSTVLSQHDPHCTGDRDTIVHLFEWKWDDIARECETFLGPYGYCGVQTSPASENRIVTNPYRPWFERYQPISYKLETRSGNETQFKNMVKTCNDHGVRIFVDVVINHMCWAGGKGVGTAGTWYDADTLDFPGVPYRSWDFNDGTNCHTHDGNIHDYSNVEEVRNCRLVTLLDLKMSEDYVRGKVAGFLNHLIDLGVAGFRVDAAKHMWPADIDLIFDKVKNVTMGGRPYLAFEVIDQGGEAIKAEEYTPIGRVTNFKFGLELARIFRRQNPMKYLNSWGTGWGMWPSNDVLNFIDNHDNQRGHGGGGGVLTHWDPRPYKLASEFMLAHPYGMPRVMSSFEFNRAIDWEGPPHNADMSIKDVPINPDMTCGDGWSCEHRWRQIYNMVGFRNVARGTGVDNWWSGADYQIAFSRGDKAFIAMNLEDFDLSATLQTGLPAGDYCDIITGNLVNGTCTGSTVTVNTNGTADIQVCSRCEDPALAIHIGHKIGTSVRRF